MSYTPRGATMPGRITIATDGGCFPNPGGPGGWAVVYVRGIERPPLTGRDPATTNNRMELLAAIRGLESLEPGSDVILESDSQYVTRGINEWMAGWKKRGWRKATRSGKPGAEVANADLWAQLDMAVRLHVRVLALWVRGHNGYGPNEEADRLAAQAARAARILR